MIKFAWITDIHFDFLEPDATHQFCRAIVQRNADVLLVGGDIGQADSVTQFLRLIEKSVSLPTYFVLGNHDYYGGAIAEVRKQAERLTNNVANLHWLPACDVVELTQTTCLVGHGGWGDGRLGDYARSSVRLNDFRLIRDLAGLETSGLHNKLMHLGDEAAAYIEAKLLEALGRYQHIILLTHVPPFKEACLYQGRIGNDEWLPHFTCKAMGDVLIRLMLAHSDRQLTVYCGHTHHSGRISILPNLDVFVGSARYGAPEIQGVYSVE